MGGRGSRSRGRIDGWMDEWLSISHPEAIPAQRSTAMSRRKDVLGSVGSCMCVCVFEILENGRIKTLFFFLIRASSWEQSRLLRSTWCSVSKSVFYRV